MKKLLLTILAAVTVLQYPVADSVVVGTVKDSVTGSNIVSGVIEFIPIDTPKTNSTGDLLFGYKTIAYINDGKFAATLTEGLYDCVIGPFNITKPITIPAGDNVINLSTIYGNTDNSLVTFFQFNALSNSLASMITGSVSGVSTFNGRSGTVTLTSNDVYTVDIAASKIRFDTNSYTSDGDVLAFAVLAVGSTFSAATNARSLIVQNLGVDPATNANNSITNNFATTNYVAYAMGEATDYTDLALLDFLNNTLSDAAVTPISTIISGLATTTYVNTSTNGFITAANAQTLTNNFATTNFVTNAVYVASKPSRITNAQDTVEIILGLKSLFMTNMAGNVTLTGPTFQSTTNEETTRLVLNANGADRTVALPAAIRTPDGARTYYVTNNTTGFLTIGGISGSYTTAVFKVLW